MENTEPINDAQLLCDKMISWEIGELSDKGLIAELIPVVMEMDARIAKLECSLERKPNETI